MKLISRITAEKLKEGDELAFEEIFYAYRNIVFFECLKKRWQNEKSHRADSEGK